MSLMLDETREAPLAAARCLAQRAAFADAAARIRALDPAVAMVCARGSSGHAGTFLRYVLARDLGLVAAAAMPSVASLYGARQRLRGALFLAISQSGRSPDLVRQAEAARQAGALCVALVNTPASPLAAACDVVIDIAAGPERAVAATKSVLNSIVAGLALVAAWTGDAALRAGLDRLPDRLGGALAADWSPLVTALMPVNRAFAVGRGPGLGVANEAALKLGETSAIAGLAYSSAELAHGPTVLAGPEVPAFAFVQADAARPGTEALLARLRDRGAPVFAPGAAVPGATILPTVAPEHPDLDLLPMLASFYVAAEATARARGRDPDNPPGLTKVTETV